MHNWTTEMPTTHFPFRWIMIPTQITNGQANEAPVMIYRLGPRSI